MIIYPSQVEKLKQVLFQFQNLRQLELFVEGGVYDLDMNYFWILDIITASQHLQKISITIRNRHLENSRMLEFKREKRKYAEFSHNDLKYVEFCGCVFSADVIELASQLLRNANSLNKMTFSSLHKFYIGAGRWTSGSDGCLLGQNVIYEMLKDEVNKQCQLIIL